MANKKYYHSEVVEFQNGDKTVARQLTITKLKILTKLFKEHDSESRKVQRRIDEEILAAKKKDPKADEQALFEEIQEQIEAEGGKTYIDTLVDGAVLALNAWGVKDNKEKNVTEVDTEYVEEHLDYPTLQRVCEIAGSMELGNKTEGDEGKASS